MNENNYKVIRIILSVVIIILFLFPPKKLRESESVFYDTKLKSYVSYDRLGGESNKIRYKFILDRYETLDLQELKLYPSYYSEKYVTAEIKIVLWLYLLPILILSFIWYSMNNKLKKGINTKVKHKINSVTNSMIDNVVERVNKNVNNNSKQNVNLTSSHSSSIKENSHLKTFIDNLMKVYNLKENGVYSDEEFKKRKIEIIINITNEGITQNIEDFLVDIIPLKDKGILNLEEINQIKSSLIAKESSSRSENSLTNAEENTDSEFTYICNNCNDEMELESEEIKNKKFVCTNCGTLNKI